MVYSKLRRHKVMEKVIKKLMANNLPPRFKFKDTYDSIEVPTAYQQHLPTQQEIEDEFDEMIAEEEAMPTVAPSTDDLKIISSNVYSNLSTGKFGIGTANPSYTLDVVGDIHLTGNIYQNSNIFTAGGDFPLQESGTEGQTDTFYVPRFITTGNPAVDIIFDDQDPNTTFTGTLDGTATRVTGAGGTGYLELTQKAGGLNNTVYWQGTLPAKWTCEFEWYLDPGSYGGADDSRFIFYGQSAITSVFPADHGAPYIWMEHYGGDIFGICDGSGTTLASNTSLTYATNRWIRFKFEFDNGVMTAHAYNNQNTPVTISYDFGTSFSNYYNTDTYFAIGGRTGGVVALQRARNFRIYVPSTETITLSDVNYTIDNSNSSSMDSLRLSNVTNGLSVLSNISVGGTVNAPYFVGDGSALINVNSESFTTLGDIVTTSGKIGIGVTQPETSLYMYDNSSNVCTLTIHDGGLSRAPKLNFLRGGDARTGSEHQYGLSNYTDWRIHVVDSTGAMYISNKGNTSLNSGNEKDVISMDIYGRVGIGVTNPSAQLSIGEWNLGAPSGTTPNTQLLLSGTHNAGPNANGGYKLRIEGYDNDGGTVYPIYCKDENSNIDFYIKNRPSASGIPTMFFAGDIEAKGIVKNISQYIDSTNRSTTSNSPVGGYTTPWTAMKANSKVKLDVFIPWRNDGTGWGGSYHLIYMMVNQQVGTVPANTWVLLSNSGYYMTYYQDIISYANSYYIPLSVSSDFSIRFYHTFRRYNTGTLYINQSHDIHKYVDNNLLQFGVSHNSAGWTKFIVQEIGG